MVDGIFAAHFPVTGVTENLPPGFHPPVPGNEESEPSEIVVPSPPNVPRWAEKIINRRFGSCLPFARGANPNPHARAHLFVVPGLCLVVLA